MGVKNDDMLGRIVSAERRNSSVNGNPRFVITISRSLDGEVFQATTSSDAACSYDVENLVRSGEEVVVGFTRAGYVETLSRLTDAPMGA